MRFASPKSAKKAASRMLPRSIYHRFDRAAVFVTLPQCTDRQGIFECRDRRALPSYRGWFVVNVAYAPFLNEARPARAKSGLFRR
jgi:hypothetical protein